MAEQFQPTDEETKTIEQWKKRFTTAKSFWRPYREKRLRFYELYRAYESRTKYAYQTKLIPPIAFEIVETVKPRLASAKMNIRILPQGKGDINSKAIESWDDLIKYDLEVINFPDLKIDWINSALIYGDGIVQLTWSPGEEGDGDPDLEVQDLELFYPDPEATDLQKDSKWEIQLLYKTKKQLEKEEEARGDEGKIYKNLECVEDKKVIDDPRKDRYAVNTKKMGQIATGEGAAEEGTATEEKMEEEKVTLLQIWDHEEKKLIVIANDDILIREDDNPYLKINNGRTFIQLTDHALLWELFGIGHIEPIETTIHEIADSRNQAMDDIVFSLDPIRKVRQDAHLTADDIVYEPGAIWDLKKADDVITERPPEISKQWLEKDEVLRREIQTSLAISEYAMGLPKGPQEPMGKVELLLMQTNIRFSLLLRQLEISMTQLVNGLIESNVEFLTEDKGYRLIGDEVSFKEFKQADKSIKVDARVEIEAKVEKTPEQRKIEAIELYKIFVAEDKPDPKDLEEIKQWKIRKRTLQKMILEEFGKEQYEDLILGIEKKEKEKEVAPAEAPAPSILPPGEMPPGTLPGTPPTGIRGLMSKIPLLKRIVR